jgi:hypothetical protein
MGIKRIIVDKEILIKQKMRELAVKDLQKDGKLDAKGEVKKG